MDRRALLLLTLLAACARPCHDEGGATDDTDPTADTDVTLGTCVHACTTLCVPAAAEDSALCADTWSPLSACWFEGYQRCERQPDATCGWTMLDQAGWDACWSGEGD